MAETLKWIEEEIGRLLEGDKPCLLVAIDGRCGGGKSTLGAYLKERFSCNLFHMDDFFLRKDQRTRQRLEEVGGNVDYERFWEEVLSPILRKEGVVYRAFSCKTMGLSGEVQLIEPRRLNIIEGSYSQHPYFGEVYDLKIFVDVSSKRQKENILRRNGEDKLKEFREKWIPREEAYFAKYMAYEENILISFEEGKTLPGKG